MGDKHVDGLDDLLALPDEIVLRLIKGQHPVRVWREYRGFTVADLARLALVEDELITAIETDEVPLEDGMTEILGNALTVRPCVLQRLVAKPHS